MRMKAGCSGVLSIHRLEGSRPRLRRTRALCKFNGGKVGRGRAPKLCGEALRLIEECEVFVETELAVTEGPLAGIDKLSAKNLTQHLARKKNCSDAGTQWV